MIGGAAFASKPAPTFEMHSPVGAGLLAKNDDAVGLKDRVVCFASKLCSYGPRRLFREQALFLQSDAASMLRSPLLHD
ncbi:hypothetical protein BK665_21405 [Pseudomonas frederiksbergensis]|uniref:Uncharacterized protein n=1 Tax=Pseudomonas frederiksbergensis TaxID=104087 RepID=A0A423KDA6_9PSED|nr:hypothetical protein BK665_21405 [Pseudomonas frederiksbergensis]